MLPIPHDVLFAPFTIFALVFAVAGVVNLLTWLTARQPAKPAARPNPAEPGAQIIYFSPRKTSLPSGLSLGIR